MSCCMKKDCWIFKGKCRREASFTVREYKRRDAERAGSLVEHVCVEIEITFRGVDSNLN